MRPFPRGVSRWPASDPRRALSAEGSNTLLSTERDHVETSSLLPRFAGPTLVLGASGLLGGRLSDQLQECGDIVVTTALAHARSRDIRLDLRDLRAVRACVRKVRPEVVFYCAAWADVDACERDPTSSYAVNVEAALTVMDCLPSSSARFVYFSTDYVFSGVGGPYDEAAETGPVNVYGQHKLAAEESLLALDRQVLIVRTSQLYDGPRAPAGLPLMLHAAARNHERCGFDDTRFNSPTHVADLVGGVTQLLLRRHSGVFHLAGPQTLSRFEAARMAAAAMGIDADTVSRASPQSGHALRPLRCGLKIDKARGLIGYQPRTLQQGVTHASA